MCRSTKYAGECKPFCPEALSNDINHYPICPAPDDCFDPDPEPSGEFVTTYLFDRDGMIENPAE
jgi:hypothetical protein